MIVGKNIKKRLGSLTIGSAHTTGDTQPSKPESRFYLLTRVYITFEALASVKKSAAGSFQNKCRARMLAATKWPWIRAPDISSQKPNNTTTKSDIPLATKKRQKMNNSTN